MVRLVAVVAAALLVACASSDVGSDAAAIDAPADATIDVADPVDATDAATDATDAPTGPDACVPQTETCNGLDDNCDLVADESFPTLGMTCMVGNGICRRTGALVCNTAGDGVECNVMAGPPGTETCNGMDDDCDTMTDEGFGVGAMCDGGDADLCTEGTVMCNASGGTGCSDNTGDRIETCNAIDDDCDTHTDEGFNLGTACDGSDADACVEGTIVCQSGGAVCSDTTASTTELCNGLDDDCRNGVDDGYNVGASCTAGVGLCQRTGSNVCNTAGTGVTCNAVPGAPQPETCGDGIDQDCSGADVTCPINDRPANPLNISAGGTFTVDLTAANNDQDFSGTNCGSTGGRDVYYTFTLPAPEVVYLDTFGSSFDTTLRVFNGTCAALGALATCFDDSCSILQSQGAISLAGGSYCLVVDQYSSTQTSGALVLNFTRGGRTGTALTATSGTIGGTSCSGSNLSVGSCQTNSTAQDAAFFFTVCPSVTRTVAASTCTGTTFDSVVYLRRGSALSTDLACNDDATGCGASGLQSSLTGGSAPGPGLFWLTVDGYLANCGSFVLTYSI